MAELMAKPFREMLKAQFGIKKDTPLVVAPSLLAPPEPKKQTKTVGDPAIALSAQAIYDPNVPSPPANPPGKMNDQGTAPAMDLKSKWDKGNE